MSVIHATQSQGSTTKAPIASAIVNVAALGPTASSTKRSKASGSIESERGSKSKTTAGSSAQRGEPTALAELAEIISEAFQIDDAHAVSLTLAEEGLVAGEDGECASVDPALGTSTAAAVSRGCATLRALAQNQGSTKATTEALRGSAEHKGANGPPSRRNPTNNDSELSSELSGMSLTELQQLSRDLDTALGVSLSSRPPPPDSVLGDDSPSHRYSAAQDKAMKRSSGVSVVAVRAPVPPPALRERKHSSHSMATGWVCDLCGTRNSAESALPRASGRNAAAAALDDFKCVECSFRPKTV